MRFARTLCALGFALALGLTAYHGAQADELAVISASPYQLGDLLQDPAPTYDLKIAGDLRFPENPKARSPAFVFLHGSGGQLARHQRYLALARDLGFATLQLDSFGPRGVSSTVGDQTNVTAAMMTTDLLRALVTLAGRPDIDQNKIVVMGSSKGAIAALYAAWTPIREKVAGVLDYAAYILLYPFCTSIEDARVTPNPLRVFIGEQDNWTPPAPCEAEVARMRGLGHDWAITLYAGAYHGFDADFEGIRSLPHAYSMVDCSVALRPDGYEYETGSGYLLTKADRRKAFRACAKKGDVKMGGQHAANPLLHDIRRVLEAVLAKGR